MRLHNSVPARVLDCKACRDTKLRRRDARDLSPAVIDSLLLQPSCLPGIFRAEQLHAPEFISSGCQHGSTTRDIPELGISESILLTEYFPNLPSTLSQAVCGTYASRRLDDRLGLLSAEFLSAWRSKGWNSSGSATTHSCCRCALY